MNKLFPPYIEGTLPAITINDTISIPFSHNPSVSKSEILGYSLLIKTVSTSDKILNLTTIDSTASSSIVFTLLEEEKQLLQKYQGEYLKVQLAYLQELPSEQRSKAIKYIKEAYNKIKDIEAIFQTESDIIIPSDKEITEFTITQNLNKLYAIEEQILQTYESIIPRSKTSISEGYVKEYYTALNEFEKKIAKTLNIFLNTNVGHYSTVGVIKICYPIEIKLHDSIAAIDNINIKDTIYIKNNTVYGLYESINDATEKVYDYQFTLLDKNNQILETSGLQLHNTQSDTESTASFDKYQIQTTLQPDKMYIIKYEITTTNKLIESTVRTIKQQTLFKVNDGVELVAEANADQAYIQLIMKFDKKFNFGHYRLWRTDETSNFKNWKQILTFDLSHEIGEMDIWKDLSIEQGISYQYGISQYNNYELSTDKLLSNRVKAIFEDTFLFDGERQLNIKFNPQISSFKDNILEQKVETIGSKYPFIFRNGHIKYKEIPISGLISYNMDTEGLFINGVDLGILEDEHSRLRTADSGIADSRNLGYNTSISELNITLERKFKLEVLEWLQNGEIKCLKSPTEGNYLVKLTNVSLSPENQTGRMLHSFSATAYETKEYNLNNVIDLWYQDKINKVMNKYENLEYTEITIQLQEALSAFGQAEQKMSTSDYFSVTPNVSFLKHNYGFPSVWFQNIKPNTKIIIYFCDIENLIKDRIVIKMNNSGYLSLENLPDDYRVQKIKFLKDSMETYTPGQITFGYYTSLDTSFEHILDIENRNIIGEQYRYDEWKMQNIIANLDNIKFSVPKFYAIQFNKTDKMFTHIKDLVKNLYYHQEIKQDQYNLITKYLPEFKKEQYLCPIDINTYRVEWQYLNDLTEFDDAFWINKDKQINWYIISDTTNFSSEEKEKKKLYLNRKNSLLYLEKLEDIKYIELGPNVEVNLSYELIERIYDFEKTEFLKKLANIFRVNILDENGNIIKEDVLFDRNYATKVNKYKNQHPKDEIYCAYWEFESLKRYLLKINNLNDINTFILTKYYKKACTRYSQLLKEKFEQLTNLSNEQEG